MNYYDLLLNTELSNLEHYLFEMYPIVNMNKGEEVARKYCYDIMNIKAKSFSFASKFFPEDVNMKVQVIYSFLRILDDITDSIELEKSKKYQYLSELDFFLNNLSSFIPNHPILRLVQNTIRSSKIPIHYFRDMISGMKNDLEMTQFNTFQELQEYAYSVAGTVGCIMTHLIMKNPNEKILRKAKLLGEAMQLTNILRDVKEDYDNGRIYLPKEMLSSFGIHNIAELIEGNEYEENFTGFMKYLSKLVLQMYEDSMYSIYHLPEYAHYPLILAGKVYREIVLQSQRENYPVLKKRVVVSKIRKIAIALKLKINIKEKPIEVFSCHNLQSLTAVNNPF